MKLSSLRSGSAIADRARVNLSGRILLLFPLVLFFSLRATTQVSPTSASGRTSPPTRKNPDSVLDQELKARLEALDATKQGDDPVAVANASRRVIALGLREMGYAEIHLSQETAIPHFKRARDFEDSPESRLDLAAAYCQAERVDECLSLVTDVLVTDSQNARAWYLQGKVWLLKLKYEDAVNSFTTAMKQQPDAGASYLLGAALLQANQYQEGKQVFRVFSSDGDPKLHRALAMAYGAAKYKEDSAREWQRAGTQEQPRDASIKDVLASARRVGSKLEVPEFSTHQRALLQAELHSVLANALNDLGSAEARQQQYDLALAHFHEAATWDANLPGLTRNTGIAAARAQNYEECIRALKPLLATTPGDNVVRSMLGTALYAMGNYGDAAQVFAPLGDAVLPNHELAYSWAASLVSIRKYSDASNLLIKLEVQKLSPDTLVLVAQLWSQMGDYEHAVAACNRAAQLDPRTTRAHYLAGLALLRLNRPSEASDAFRHELQVDPNNVEAEFHLAFSLLQQSQNNEAVELWKKVLAAKPDHSEANYELGKELLIEGKAQESLTYLEAAVQLKPQFEPAHYQLQSAYRAVGRKEDADREANIYRALKAKSRNIKLPPPPEGVAGPESSN